MNYDEYQKLKARYIKDRDNAHNDFISAEAKLAGLEEIYKALGSRPSKHKNKTGKKNKSEYAYDPSQEVNKTDIMRKSLGELGETFKTKNFKAYLKKTYPRVDFYDTFISNTLGKFVRKGILEIVSSGKEKKKGYVYRRKTG